MLDRDEDMLVTGGRHPYHGKYKVGRLHLLVGVLVRSQLLQSQRSFLLLRSVF